MLDECCLAISVAHFIATAIIVEKTIETDTLDRDYEGADGSEGLQSAACSDSYNTQGTKLIFFHTRGEVNIDKCVEFVHHNVDIVTSDASA